MLKMLNGYIISVHEDLTIDKENNRSYHKVHIIHLKSDNTYMERHLYYDGSIDTFNNMSDIHLINLLSSLLNKNDNNKFSLKLEATYNIY
jgi:hypothetical protein